jgi:hypothetical protein
MFAYPTITPGNLSLENPRVYAVRFSFVDGNDSQPYHLLEPNKSPPLPARLSYSIILKKMSSLVPATRALVINYSSIMTIKYNLSHFFMLLLFNCLPFHSRTHHFMETSSFCAICGSENGDNPNHLLSQCKIGRDALVLLQSEDPQLLRDFYRIDSALLSSRVLSGIEIIKHICFAKAMWKARCAAIWSDNTISPFRIVDLYRDIRKRTKKLKCDTNAQPIVSADDLAEFNINNNSLV